MRTNGVIVVAVVAAAAFVATVPGAVAQKPKIDPDQRYLLLAAQRTGTMQQELNEAAAQGFKVLAGSPSSQGEVVLFLERVAQPPATYTYRLLATTNTSTMERELNEAVTDGFRLLPLTTMAQASAGRRLLGGGFAGSEIMVVVERPPKADTRYEYKLLATSRTGTMQREVSEAVAANFVLVGMLSRDEHMVVMERQHEQ
jgi:hypothetical protein